MAVAKHLNTVVVRSGLVLAGEVQIDIRHLVAAEAQEGFEGDVEALLGQGRAALGADRVRKVCTAGHTVGHFKGGVLAFGAAVVGRKRVDLGDTGQIRHNGRADRASGAHQIAVLQRVLHQLLGTHIDHIVMAGDDVVHLLVHALLDKLRRMVAVEPVQLAVDQVLELAHRVLDGRRKQAVGHRTQRLTHVGNQVRIFDHDFIGLLLAKIRELLQHLVRGLKVQRQRPVGVLKLVGRQQQVPVDLVLRVEKVDIARGHHGDSQFLSQGDHRAVEVPQLLLALRLAVVQHKVVVAQGLNLQKIVEGRNPLQL